MSRDHRASPVLQLEKLGSCTHTWFRGASFVQQDSAKSAIALALCAITVLLMGSGNEPRPPICTDLQLATELQSIVVASPPSSAVVLERIAIGSCLHQGYAEPILDDVIAARPQLFLMMGDNVYGDFDTADAKQLAAAYAAQAHRQEFRRARAAVPILAIWDDHDLGKNDGGADFPFRVAAARLFHQFWGTTPERPVEEGLYYSRFFGPTGRRVQIIMLDTRSFRSPLKPKTTGFDYWGPYEPDSDPAKTMLGPAQWAWLEQELSKPADLRLLVSSIQVFAEGHGWERWGNFPLERERLLRLLSSPDRGAIVFLSGDRHSGALYRIDLGARETVELTSSSLNLPPPGPNKDARLPPLVSDIFPVENFGFLTINWDQRRIEASLLGLQGRLLAERSLAF
jgi:alkaline phosphatase D